MTNFTYCPKCKENLHLKGVHPHCSNCKETYYKNPKPTAGMFILNKDQILICKRSINPKSGTYDIPGGFLEVDEGPKETIIREVKEETGLTVKIIHLLGIYKDQYGNNGRHLINIFYVGKVVLGKMKAQDDIKDLEWVNVDNIPKMGFKSVDEGVKDFLKWYDTNKI